MRRSLINSEGLFRFELLRWSEEHPGTVILESNPGDSTNRSSYLFAGPVDIVQSDSPDDVQQCLERIDRAVAEGYHAAGFCSYEAGKVFEKRLPGSRPGSVPILWFGIYDRPVVFDRQTGKLTGHRAFLRDLRESLHSRPQGGVRPFDLPHFRSSISETGYLEAFNRVQRYIEAGDTYQVNLTFRLHAPVSVPASLLYDRMRRAQRVAYGAFLNVDPLFVLSCSPELFFRKEGNKLTLKPMKGTVARGRTVAEDSERRKWLLQSEKNRAENLMIVDLLRNDAGKIARAGSVRVKRFFDVERYETVFQATSTIEATLKPGTSIPELMRSLFPSGSVTGAPKIRTMEIIDELETRPRGVYTGGIGFFSPAKSVFNVAIRTLVLNRASGEAEFGVGSGIVHDSRGTEEYKECLLKAKFLEQEPGEFSLIETILWSPRRGWSHVGLHMRRLKESASYFGFRFRGQDIRDGLEASVRRFKQRKSHKAFRVRLLLARQGEISTQVSVLEPLPTAPVVRFASRPTDPDDRFLFHKTTNRALYEDELARAIEDGYVDVLFRNKHGEITEGARSNILIRRGSALLTPPLECGVLPGTYRSFLLSSEKYAVREQRLYPDDLFSADEIFLCNALRGLVRVTLHEHTMSA